MQYKNSEKSEKKEENIKELLFSGGAGCIGFMMGYLHGLIEIVGKEELKKYKLGGVSAGNAAALFFHMTLHQDKYDMKYFHQQEISKYFSKMNKKYGGLFTNYKVIHDNSMNYWKLLTEFGEQIPDINGIYHCVVTEWNGWFKFKKTIIDDFRNKENLSTAIQSSCQIPLFTSPSVFTSHNGKKLMDGGFVGSIPYKYENSQKIFLNMMPKVCNFFANLRKEPKNLTIFNITEGQGVLFPRDYYIWSEEWNDEMFLKGYFSAIGNIQEICKAFGISSYRVKNSTIKENEQNQGNQNLNQKNYQYYDQKNAQQTM